MASSRRSILPAPERLLERGWFVPGDETSKFEEEFTSFTGARFGIGANSGSDALYLSAEALDISTEDEVVTVSHI